jgi:hypothetical protein
MISPRAIPDCCIAQGIDTTADPIMVFQQLNIMTVDDAFAFFMSVSSKLLDLKDLPTSWKGFVSRKWF